MGMDFGDARRVVEQALPGAVLERNEVSVGGVGSRAKFTLFTYRLYDRPVKGRGQAIAISASPATNKIWMVAKMEAFPAGQRLPRKTLFDAFGRFGTVRPALTNDYGATTEYRQEWAKGADGQDLVSPNGSCVASWKRIGNGVDVFVPVGANPKCAVAYGASIHTTDGLSDMYTVWATNPVAFVSWMDGISAAQQSRLNDEAARASKPSF